MNLAARAQGEGERAATGIEIGNRLAARERFSDEFDQRCFAAAAWLQE